MARRRQRKVSLFSAVATVLVAVVAWGFNTWQQQESTGNSAGQTIVATDNQATYDKLANLDYVNNSAPIVTVDHNRSGLNLKDWQGPKIDYGNLDQLNRTTTVTGYLDQRTLIRSAGRPSQNWEPTGWHNRYTMVNGRRVNRQNRGHLIAYTVSGNLDSEGNYQAGELGSSDNPKNLASQTEYANQVLMQTYEEAVRSALAAQAQVIYKVTTVFRGSELMPRGYWLRAKSSNGDVDFNVYIYNVQNGIKYDYATGRSTVDASVEVKQD
ncbi:DNA/RNA non-specific endonuclease [Lacticaseibacillus daqingensis]|uniref:DNA/RNA non-specific endonuclease n=1 Tax=Lacticaseibacillus daqingensis TaxID=2486014 RepID=UPI000F776FC6|nr:DNA/RNA non-specific endonuclease [Lacticaseibacillus daqingensis]